MTRILLVAAFAVFLSSIPLSAQQAQPAQPAMEASPEECPQVWMERLPELAGAETPATPTAIDPPPSCSQYSQHPAPVQECWDDDYCIQLCENNNELFVWTIVDRYSTQCWCICCT